MSLFGLLSMIGGLALFLYGMHIMSEGLEKGGSYRRYASGQENKNRQTSPSERYS